MARIPVWDEDDPATPDDVRAALDYTRDLLGENPNVIRLLANHPEIARRYINLARVPYGPDSTLTKPQRELAYTTASSVNNCFY